MSDSETSSDDLNINFLNLNDNKKEVKKVISSTTDMYNNLIANPAKEKEVQQETSSITKTSNNEDNSTVNSSSSSERASERRASDERRASERRASEKRASERRASERRDSSSSRNSNKSKKSDKSKSSKKTFSPVNIRVTETNKPKPVVPEVSIKLTAQQIRMKKIEMLRKLSEIKAKGYELSKKYDFNSSIEEMEYEYELLKSFANKRNGIKLYKNIILNTASAIEFLNDKYDPFEFKLSGWSEHMSVEVDSYEDVLEELYEKYKGKGSSMPPEIKLVLLIVTSASAFHFTKSYAQNSAIEAALKSNPGMIASMLNKKKEQSQFMTQQEINLQRQKEIAIQREKMQRENAKKPNLGGFTSNFNPATEMNANPPPRNVNIKAPSNVQEILARLHNSEENSKQNSRIVSETNMTSDTEKKRGRKKKKNLISVI